MARKKGSVIGVEEYPVQDTATASGVDGQLETPSASFSTSSTNPTCPHCSSVYKDMSITEFRDHVASCSHPSTADDDDASSALTTPPASPSQIQTNPADADEGSPDTGVQNEKITSELPKLKVHDVEPSSNVQEGADKPESEKLEEPRPYVNFETEFEYYDQTEQNEPQEGSDADQPAPGAGRDTPNDDQKLLDINQNPLESSQNTSFASQKAADAIETGRFPFPKVTEAEVFEKYLENAEDLTTEELYRRTDVVSNSLVKYQIEWDAIDKEIYQHEANLKAEQKRAEEEMKAIIEEERVKDDAEREEVVENFKVELKLNGKKWHEFLAKNEDTISHKTLRHLQNLRNPQFMAAARKKIQAALARAKKLINAPWPEVKKTKEDFEWERRQRGRYMDPVKFDDMKHADVYGFEYSAHIKHYAQQPQSVVARGRARQVKSNANSNANFLGDDVDDASRNRNARNAPRKKYDADASDTLEESVAEEDGQKLQKRIRKPKIFVDGVETSERSRGQSRSGTPAVRTFASGKRVGRPPAKSKLQAVQLARPLTPELASGSEAPNFDGLIQNESEQQTLAQDQESQLHDAAEHLVNQTQSGSAADVQPIVKKKHAGGRPKKVRSEASTKDLAVVAPQLPKAKRKPAGGRAKKNAIPDIPLDVDSENPYEENSKPLKPKPKKRVGRVKKESIPGDDHIQVGEDNIVQSLEHDDGSKYTSENSSRPTTSDSNVTSSSFGSRRSARASTREKTNAREARAALKLRGSNATQELATLPTSTRSKRKRGSDDTDPSPIIVETIQSAGPVSKKRKGRGKQEEMTEELPQDEPVAVHEASSGRPNKRKRGATTSESITAAQSLHLGSIDLAPPTKKSRRKVKLEGQMASEAEEVDSDAGIDEDSLDPIAREALRKKRIKKEKSRKLSANMRKRWQKGEMKHAQETRKTNNAIRRDHKQKVLINQAAGLPPPPLPQFVSSTISKSRKASKSAPTQEAELDSEDYDEPKLGTLLGFDSNASGHSEDTDEPKLEIPTFDPNASGDSEDDAEMLEIEGDPVETPTPPTASPSPAPVSTKRKRTKLKSKALPPKRPASTRTRKPTRMAMGFDGVDDEDDDEEAGEDEDEIEPFTSEYDQYQALTSPRKPVLLGKRTRKPLVDLRAYMNSDEEEEISSE